MKKITFFIAAIVALGLMFSCEKDGTKPVLDMSKTIAPAITEPASNSEIVLLEAQEDSLIMFKWSAVVYELTDLEDAKYSLQMGVEGANFANAKEIKATTDLSATASVLDLNNLLLSMGFPADSIANVELRVVARVNSASNYTVINSAVAKLQFMTYLSAGAAAPPLYLIGDGTTIGWNNTNTSLQFAYDATDEVYKIVATLGGGGKFIKAFEVPGQWAPQWGTDATGTSAGGPLVYRPTEDVPDPAAIPTPEEPGDYLIIFDLVNKVYSVQVANIAQTMHIIGDATEAGWDNSQAIPMTKTAPGKFQLVANLSADASEGFKFLVNQGAWAPMYGTVVGNSFDSGVLIYRATESDPDPKSIVPPATTGAYLIQIDIVALTYTVTAQ